MDYNLVFVLTLLVLAEAEFELASRTIPQRSLREIASKRKQLNYLKAILHDLDNKLEKLEKRSCPINIPGMDCDYGYIKGSGKDHNIWMNEIGPGKKRSNLPRFRKRLCAFNLPGMDCDFGEIRGIGKDHSTWISGEGPGKKRSNLPSFRKRLCAFNLPGMDCDFGEYRGIGKDHSAWISGEGPGKKRRYPPLLQKQLQNLRV